MKIQTLHDKKKHIELLMQYAVPEEYRDEAADLVNRYDADIIALNLFEAFYSYLPEAQDDAINKLRLIDGKQGNFLICASTLHDDYVYNVSSELAEFLGTTAQGIWDEEVLAYFGFADRESFIKLCSEIEKFDEYKPTQLDTTMCPACSVASGDHHAFGCPVEVCPWCGGQLINCDCRFRLLGIDRLDRESQADKFLEILESKGRVPFDAALHRPAYPSEKEVH